MLNTVDKLSKVPNKFTECLFNTPINLIHLQNWLNQSGRTIVRTNLRVSFNCENELIEDNTDAICSTKDTKASELRHQLVRQRKKQSESRPKSDYQKSYISLELEQGGIIQPFAIQSVTRQWYTAQF